MRVALLVTHLLGTGHLKRASLLADGFVQAGHEAIVISGGFPAPNAAPHHADLIQLSPLRSDAGFTTLYRPDGQATSGFLGQRIIEIGEALTGFAPDMLITELFPFGRRKLATEFEAAVAAVPDTLVYSSVRDILQYPRKPDRVSEAEDRFARLYDGAFLHGDPALVPMQDSWDLPPDLMKNVHYTGYVTETPSNEQSCNPASAVSAGKGEIIVAAGGGSVGDRLFEAAADAADETWRLLIGGHDRAERIAWLKARGSKAIIEPVRPDFTELLTNARLAILQCGYNTAMDVTQSGVRSLFVPFEGDGETEQLTRARAFSKRFGCGLIREKDLSAEALLKEADKISDTMMPDYTSVSLKGVENTVAMAETILSRTA